MYSRSISFRIPEMPGSISELSLGHGDFSFLSLLSGDWECASAQRCSLSCSKSRYCETAWMDHGLHLTEDILCQNKKVSESFCVRTILSQNQKE